MQILSSNINVGAFIDSDFAINPNNRKSVTGYLMNLDNIIIYWGSQHLSSSESEYTSPSTYTSGSLLLGQMLNYILK